MTSPDPDRMLRTTVYLTADLLDRVRDAAARSGSTSAQLIRSAISTALGDHRPPPRGGFLP